ncbi:TPA: hypothetical protein OQU49_004459, partial [Shigella flexneri]|nr:hypothetical protein [Shigella flexneri]
MPEWLTELLPLITPVLLVLAGGGGVIGMWIKSRESVKAGVTDADVTRQENSGKLALEISRDLYDRIGALETGRDEDRQR